MKYIIIGLGSYGKALAEELISGGYEVVGIDNDPAKVEAVKDFIPSVFQLDATDKISLSVADIKKDDVFIVALGKRFGMSIKIAATIKSLTKNRIYVRAIDKLHEAVLEGLNISDILNPEKDSSRVFVQSSPLKGRTEIMKVDEKHSIIKLTASEKINGITIGKNGFDKFSLKVLMISKRVEIKNILGISSSTQRVIEDFNEDTVINTGDMIIVYGENDNIRLYWEYYSN
ncbi:MAG: NAD-binding protein [Bacteroidales bacterium]